MKNIHILPTDKPSRLYSYKNNLFLTTESHLHSPSMEYKNIYITSDEEIKVGDWYKSGKFIWQMKYPQWGEEGQGGAKKIVLTTDQELIKDGIQAIDYINKEQQKQHLIDMMKDDEELGLYDDIKANRIELVCKDCSDSLEDCTCIISTIDLPKQEIKLEEVFNDDKKENIKKFIDEINNPSQPNQALKDAAERLSELQEGTYTPQHKITYKHGFEDGAKWQREQYTIEEQHVGHTIDELDKEYIKGFNEGSNYYIERMYSEEEVIAFGEFIFKHSLLTHTRGVKSLFEKFKKK